jgi:drug/metabolite transporter (DMT)-like permease
MKISAIVKGIGFLVSAAFVISIQNIVIKLAQASVDAPFEYVSLPINMMWGFLIWREIPAGLTLAGAFLTLGSGLYVLYRERAERPLPVPASK